MNLRKNMKALTLLITLFAFVLIACQTAPTTNGASEIKQATVQETSEAVKKDGVQFVDVRTPDEFKTGRAATAKNMPLETFEKDLASLDKEKPVYVICQTGRRSQIASERNKKAGFKSIFNVTGGTSAWTGANLPIEK
mgnify:CR=1 FL=1